MYHAINSEKVFRNSVLCFKLGVSFYGRPSSAVAKCPVQAGEACRLVRVYYAPPTRLQISIRSTLRTVVI